MNFIEILEKDSIDLSVSAIPESLETKMITSIKNQKNKRFNWMWNQGRSGINQIIRKKHAQKERRKNSGNIIPNSPKDFFIDGNNYILFGEKKIIDFTGQEPDEKGLEDFVYSNEYGTPPYSFLEDDRFDKKAPPPVYFKFEEINAPKPVDKDEVLQAFELNAKGYLECVDEEIKESNKGIIPYVLKELAKNVLTGKGIVSISLPVRIFQPKSLLERILDACSFVPTFFK